MAEAIEDSDEAGPGSPPRRRRIWRRVLGALLLLLVALATFGWIERKQIVDHLITRELNKLGLRAHYHIVSIGPRREIIDDIVIGDPARPDLTIERAEFSVVPRFPLVGIGRMKLVKPRLYGTYLNGKLSFGALDPLIFKPSTKAFELPDMDLAIEDGRALIESDYGAVGFKAQGNGNLRGGFAGIVAANAPHVAFDGCEAARATLYGKVTIDAEEPHVDGPLRLGSLTCADRKLALKDVAIKLQTKIDRGLNGMDGKAGLTGGALRLGGNRVAAFDGSAQFSWRNKALNAQYKLGVEGVDTSQLALASLSLDGSARSQAGFQRMEMQADVQGQGLRPGKGLDASLRDGAKATSGTLVGPMLEQIRRSLAREGPGSTLTADVTLRRTGKVLSMVVPQARLRGRGGETLLALSSFQASGDGGGVPRFSGNFSTGGPGLPQINGRMESVGGSSGSQLHMKMAEYKVAGGSLELPQLLVSQARDGTVRIAGNMVASGPVPGGSAEDLRLPLKGSWSNRNGLVLWPDCTDVAFDRLELASLSLDKHSLQLCPSSGQPILHDDRAGLRIAAGVPSLELTGKLAETPIVLKSGPVGVAYPGDVVAKEVDVALGPKGSESRFHLADLNARVESDLRGQFSGADVRLFSVPLDVLNTSGAWRYTGGRLELTGGDFRLVDRQKEARFAPLAAHGATLTLADNRITASALLQEPKSGRTVVQADIVHDLDNGVGHADLDVPGILFDQKLQVDELTPLALGVVANAKGTVTGKGRIDWNDQGVTSSGQVSTQDFDFAAAFGPVHGVSGTVKFTDLLGMVTAPDQHLHIASFNPGIEVEAGDLNFAIRPDYELVINGGSWPFLGGKLMLEPTSTRMNVSETRRYTLKMEGIDAALFVQRMDLANFSATGLFDGELPLVFDENGGRIEGGHLASRPPGGNVAYVGALTYKDLSTMGNYAFKALRSLDYKTMGIDLNGPLTGEIVTKVRFGGISQGEGASKNFITRQIGRLPIHFNVTIKAPFYRLITSFKSLYDPAYAKSPIDVGLIDAKGNRIDHSPALPAPATKPQDLPSDEANIQHPASE